MFAAKYEARIVALRSRLPLPIVFGQSSPLLSFSWGEWGSDDEDFLKSFEFLRAILCIHFEGRQLRIGISTLSSGGRIADRSIVSRQKYYCKFYEAKLLHEH